MPSATPPTLTALLLAASTASATITIPTVSVGDRNNPTDSPNGGYGRVTYNYHIGTYEVTNSQYTAFLNAMAVNNDPNDLYNPNMSISFGEGAYSATAPNEPVAYTSFWDAARFANWLTNGQPTGEQGTGTTEDGMYNLGGVTDPVNSSVTRQLDFSAGENGVAVASEDEWYKAAYYYSRGNWYDYPTQSDQAPQAEGPPGSNNSANYNNAVDGGSVTEVGAYPNSGSYYGTFDQGGNVSEWNDEIVNTDGRGQRGGSFSAPSFSLKSSSRSGTNPTGEGANTGFRVTSLTAIPEPSSYGAIFGIVGLATAVFFRRRRRRE